MDSSERADAREAMGRSDGEDEIGTRGGLRPQHKGTATPAEHKTWHRTQPRIRRQWNGRGVGEVLERSWMGSWMRSRLVRWLTGEVGG